MQGGDVGGTPGVRRGHNSLADTVVLAFLNRGYRIVDYTDVKGCVDFVAKSDSNVFVIRVLSNVDALREESVREFVRLAAAVHGTPLIVGERTKKGSLEDGVVYRRYGVSVVTPATLERILDGELPVFEEFKGKRVVYFDSGMFRAAREAAGLSQSELAVEVGTTKDSIYRYEHGFPASESTARKIIKVLGRDVISPVDLGYKGYVRSESIMEFRRAPWDVFVSVRESLALSRARGILQRKINVLRRGAGVAHDLYAVIAREDTHVPKDVPVVTEEELAEVKKPDEIVKKVRDELDELEG